MSGIESWSTTPANNNQAPPFGWPAGILPSQVEPIGRQMMTSLAAWYQAAEWINYNFPIVYSSATVFTISTNATTLYHVGRRVQATDGSTSVFGTITASVFSSLTTITVVWDSGVLQTGVTIVYVGITSKVNTSAPTQALTSAAFANPSASIGLAAVNGTATTAMASDSAPALSQGISPTWTGTHTFSNAITVNGAGSSLKGGVTITPPSTSGIALAATGAANSYTAQITGSGTTGQSFGLRIAAGTNASDAAIGIANSAATATLGAVFGNGSFQWGWNGSAATLSGTGSGNVVIPAPSSGNTLALTGASGFQPLSITNVGAANAITIAGPTATQIGAINFQQSGQTAWSIYQPASSSDFRINGGGDRLAITSAGNVTINAPSSGAALSVTGPANSRAALFSGSSTSGQSFGVFINAGTTSADSAVTVQNQAQSLNYFSVRGDGVVFGNDGTNPFELGYKDVPLNNQGANYTAVLADRGKAINANTSITVTIPSAVFSPGHVLNVTVGSGATVTIAQGGGMTLQWVGNGATTGNRTLTGAGMASILFLTASVALISGGGLS